MVRIGFTLTSAAKYPPTTYYFSYALFIGLGLYDILSIKSVLNIFDNKFIYFTSKYSFDIY